MYSRQFNIYIVFALCMLTLSLSFTALNIAQEPIDDKQIIERYKLMLRNKPKEGSTFDRLYQLYLEGAGLDALLSDYQAEAEVKPDDTNIQLILGHIYKRLRKETDAVNAYKRAVELEPNSYYPHFALGQTYTLLLQHENAINALKQAATLAKNTQDATPEEFATIYKSLGRAYFRRDRIDEAISAWSKIAELNPNDIFARTELADLFIEQELYQQAIEQHEAIMKLKKDDPYQICLSHREIGNIHEAQGDYQKAIQSYDGALTLTAPGNWLRKDLQHRIIGIFAADSDWQGLIRYYQQKLEKTPNEPELLGLLAAAYIENQQLDEGIKGYRKGLELAPTDTNLRLDLIAALRNDEQFAEAAVEYEVIRQQDPDDFGIYRELGELYIQLEDEEKARSIYQQMLDRDPNNASTHLILAEIYTGNEWIEDATKAYQKAISLAPNNLDYIEYFGEFYLRQGSRDKAIETWNLMVADSKGIAENYNRLAKLLSSKNFHTEAIAASQKVVELMPDVYEYRKVLAQRLMKHRDFDAAQIQFAEAAKIAPNTFFAEEMDDQRIELYRRQGTLVEKIETLETDLEKSGQSYTEIFAQQKRLAKMYLKLGNITYALEVTLKAKELKPDDVVVNRWLADVYIKQNRLDDANAVYMHLIQVDSANAREYWTNITHLHLNVMDFDAATEAAKQVIANSPRNPEGYQLLAEISKQQAKYDSAIDNLKQAIRLRPDAINIRTELAETYKFADKPRQALAQYWRCWELCDTVNDKISFVKPISETYYDLGQSREFKEKLKQLSKSNPSDTAPVLALAELHRMEGDLPSARFQLARALDKQRNDPNLLSQLVSISLNLGDNQDALSYQERLVKAHPDPTHQRRLGELLFDAGREQEAIQAWTKLLHAKNQSLEAEVKLAILLIQHGHLNEAILVLDRAAEKITGKDAHLTRFQLGTVFVSMNEFDRAQSHFKHILNMQKPPRKRKLYSYKKTFSSIYYDKFDIARYFLYDIQDQSYRGRNVQAWKPSNFDEAQAGALVHLMTISQYQGKLNQFIQNYEKQIENNPKDIKTLEILAQIYTLTENTEKTEKTLEQLIAASPNDSTYQSIQFNRALRKKSSPETLENYLSKFPEMDEEKRLLYDLQYINRLYLDGKKTEAEKLIRKYEDIKVMDLDVIEELIETLALMMKPEIAERVLDRVPLPTQSQQSQYRYLYNDITNTYLNLEQYEKAMDLFWTYCTRTQPQLTNIRRMASLTTSSSPSSSSLQVIFPARTVYFEGSRLGYLKTFSRQLWFKNQHEALFTKLKTTFDASEGRDRIFPGLALSYCYWWNGEREKAQEILVSLQKEFPNDLSLKLNTVFISIQTGQNAGTFKLLEELSNTDPSNRNHYYNLILKLAIKSGNTVVVRDLITNLLKTPSSARELYSISKQLQNAGYIQHASAIMNKGMNLAMGVQDPNFLMDVSELLEDLGRGQHAAQIAERALRFANKRDRYGRTISIWKRQQATHLTSQTNSKKERETLLIEAAKKNPNSYRAQLNLADFYHGKDQIDKASAAFKKALELRPTDASTRKRFADLLFQSGRYDEAVTEYTRLLKDNPNSLAYDTWDTIECFFKAEKDDELISLAKGMISPSIGRDYNNDLARDVAYELRDLNRHTEAIEIYDILIQAQPTDPYYHRNKAGAYAQLNEYDKAIQILRDALDIDDEYSLIITIDMLIRYYKSLGKLNELITEFEDKLARKPNDNNLRFFLAKMKIAENDLKGAEELTSQMLNEEPINTNYLNRIAEAYRLTDAREREQHILEKIVQKRKGYWHTYRRLGMIYALKGETEKAQDAYRKMARLRIRSGNWMDSINVASIFIQEQMWEEAEPLLTEIINDQSVQSHHRREAEEKLVSIKKRQKDLSKTTQLKDRIREMDIGTLRTLAKDFVRRGEKQNALLIYTHLEEVIPEDFESRAQLATLYTAQNQHEKAVKTWETLLAEDPNNTKFQDGLVNTYQKAGKIDKALETTQQFIDEDIDNPINYERKAKLYAVNDEIDKAIASYQTAIELAPGNVKRYKDLAALYIRKDDKDAAKMAFQEALRFTGQEYERQRIQKEILKLSGSKEKIEETVQKAADAGTITFDMQKERAKTFKDNGKLTEAGTAYEKALEMTSDSYERRRIYEQLLEIYPKIGNDEAALKAHDELAFSVYIANSAPLARDRLIRAYKNINKLDVLTSIFKTRLDNDPDSIVNLEMLATIYNSTEQFGKAAETYKALSELQPSGVMYYYKAAAAYNRDGQTELAREMLKQGESDLFVSNNNDSRYFLEDLGNICYDGKLYDAAIKLADAAIAESANSRVHGFGITGEYAYKLLAKSYYAAKRYEEAVYTYQQVLNMADYSWDRDDARRKIESASRLGNLYEKQIPKLLKKVQEYPNDPDARLNLAQTCEKANKHNDAITHYAALSQLQPDNVQWHKKIGSLYLQMPPEKRETGEVRKSNALTLKGNGSFVEVPPSESLDSITDQVTVSAWIYPTSFPNNYVRIVFKSDEKRQNYRQRSYILVIRQDGKLKINASPKAEGYASLYSAPNLIKLNTWTHIAGVINAKQDYMKVFVNGLEVGNRHFNGQDSLMQTQLPLRIGATHVTAEVETSLFIGQIDEVRIWNIARIQQEILTDMNHELNGNEQGLVAYWKFDGETNGITLDSTDNKNHGTLIGDASITPYVRDVFESTKASHFTKAAVAFNKAIELDPTSYELYRSLVESYTKLGQISNAEKVYIRALDAPLTQDNHNDAIKALWAFYSNTENQNNGIAKLEELQQKIKNNAALYELLGDAYEKAGEPEKAKNAYTQWVELRQRQVNQQGSASTYRDFAREILDKGILPEAAIKNAKLAAQLDNSSENVLTLGYVYLVIGQKPEALEQFKKGLLNLSSGTFQRKFFGWLSDYGNNTDDKEAYVALLTELVNTISNNVIAQLNLNLLLAEYCLKNDMQEKYKETIRNTGFIVEDFWLHLGPFDNNNTNGLNIVFIQEEATEMDLNAKYDGKNGEISWKQLNDDDLNAFINLGEGLDNCVGYAFTTITSPDDREVQFRFDSDDQGKVWLNGKEVFVNTRTFAASIDRLVNPVNLKKGRNSVLVKVNENTGGWGFYLRVTDQDGNPFDDLVFSPPEY